MLYFREVILFPLLTNANCGLMFRNYVSVIMYLMFAKRSKRKKRQLEFCLLLLKKEKKLERRAVNIFKRNLMSLKLPLLQHFISRGLCLMNLISSCIRKVIKTSLKIITLISSNSSRIYMLLLTPSL